MKYMGPFTGESGRTLRIDERRQRHSVMVSEASNGPVSEKQDNWID